MFRFRRFRSRVAFFVLGLLALVQIAVFLTVDLANAKHAREQIAGALEIGVSTFRQLIDSRSDQLAESVRILAADFAFKSAIATKDVPTIQSVLQNHGSRVGADAMLLVSLERTPVADAAAEVPRPLGSALSRMIEIAEAEERAAGAISFDGKPYRMIILPATAPFPVGWLVAGFGIDDRLARDMRQITQLETSFVASAPGKRRVIASSLPPRERTALGQALGTGPVGDALMVSIDLAGEEYLSRVVPLGGASELEVVVQRSLAKELRPFEELRLAVLLLSVGGLVLSVFGAFFIARSVTRPVQALAEAARAIEKGGEVEPVRVRQGDELGELGNAFNRMMRGLAERDKVRSLLGKVVSPEIAEKLLSRDVELGGEEREVTMLFSDLRGFTTYSESRDAHEIVAVLNEYFTRMSAAIEAHNGVVDKYLGDGMMALFGAPVSHEDDAGNAMAAALAMIETLEEMNRGLARRGLPPLSMGIGINTANVVAGNLGGPNRLNYTVIGDGVNLAARLEGLAGREGFNAVVIAAEATVRRAKRRFKVLPLGETAVRGRTEPVSIYAVTGYHPEPEEKTQ